MPHILLIEDDPIWQIKIKLLLEDLEHSVVSAGSIAETTQILEVTKPDLILADIKLQDGLSFDFFKENNPNCPIIFVTEIADKTFADQVLTIPFASFLLKPVQPLIIYAAIATSIKAFQTNSPKKEKVLSVPIRYGKKIDILLSSISWIIIEGNYSTIQTNHQRYVQKVSFSKILPLLDERFIQIHKSAIINKEYISSLNLIKNNVTIGDKILPIGRSFRRKFIDAMYKSAN